MNLSAPHSASAPRPAPDADAFSVGRAIASATPESAPPNRPDDHFYDELTRTNSDLANLQRDLARKNAELAAAQRKLLASEQRYLGLSACSPIGILEMDLAGRCLYSNPHWQTISGLTADETLGAGWLRVLDPRDAPDFQEAWTLALTAGADFSRELRLVTTAGAERCAQLRARSILSERGAVAGHVCTVEDITPRKQAEAALEAAHRTVVDLSRQAGMAEVAAGVLHNVGNVLNSVNVSAALVVDQVRKSGCASLTRVVALLREHEADLGEFITADPQGRQIPAFLGKLAGKLGAEQSSQIAELAALQKNLEQIREVVAMHQNYARVAGPKETVQLDGWLEETLRLEGAELLGPDLTVVREFSTVPALTVDKPKLRQILGHLLRNAGQACADSARPDPQVTLRLQATGDRVQLAVCDNGVGIPAENLTRIFNHGFSTRPGAHGFGLHDAANAARLLGGQLGAQSPGPGQGATFTLELPLEPAPAA